MNVGIKLLFFDLACVPGTLNTDFLLGFLHNKLLCIRISLLCLALRVTWSGGKSFQVSKCDYISFSYVCSCGYDQSQTIY